MSNPPTVAKFASDKVAEAAGAALKVPRSAVEGIVASGEDTRKRKFEEYQVKRSKNQKDSMELLIQELDNYEPGIPDDVVAHFLSKGGFDAADKRSIRAVSLLAHKFIMDVADEAMQITSRRSSSRAAAGAAAAAAPAGKEKHTLTIDVVMHALRQKGVSIYKPSIIKDFGGVIAQAAAVSAQQQVDPMAAPAEAATKP